MKYLLSLSVLAAGCMLLLEGCALSPVTKTTTVTPGVTGGAAVTNVTYAVDMAVLDAECGALSLVGTPAVTYLLVSKPAARPIVEDIQWALTGALTGADANIISTINGLISQDAAVQAQFTPLIQAASALRGQLIAKYGVTVAGQIALAILQADLGIVNSALAAVPAPAK